MSEETIFDKILAKKIPAEMVYEDEFVLAFQDINPQAPVHVLVIPRVKYRGFAELKDGEPQAVGEFITRISKVADQLGLAKDGYRVVFNEGKHGQQSVDYIHAHILGGRSLSWPPG